ncbi:5'-AMP-activated protein kinase subunit beta-2-like isoform X1 [Branchiostoma floridae]|uniref:5'-AMP-activated protein kinase subunit beta-1 n=1 Tax=Branchiostoma floridae TaxID=7739 RepID=A0A9J7KXN8_BRAFL|nr:5'-AMP-activated protein kinase subunit beta-2-like isoform X1 [Branchiostoma floridae]XP_035671467.1 5'-AMP-activated protein kinase subunit beta-2-like isoform X1 [Branchiostoma floridae]XP_035671474.1 5'-AMP-activated protein kinase subunit beta-2-like isoform X1 [Branchiostoma floridae]
MGTTGSKRERSDSGGGVSRDSLDADRLDLSRPGSKIMVGSPLEDAFEFSPSPSVKSASMRIPDQQQASKSSSAKKDTVPTMFRWRSNAKTVAMAGSFNEWATKIPLNKSHNDFVTFIDLPEGRHEYKFYVDGQWVHNPDVPSVDNQLGTLNNVVEVKKSDFEVFDALASDLDSLSSSAKGETTRADVSGSPPGPYGQSVPERSPYDRIQNPPILPPQLLQVILNKDMSVQCEPTSLPEPHHVMLNHLYALSIKDGVMVLSATHRYKKKYVTTLLYRPIT